MTILRDIIVKTKTIKQINNNVDSVDQQLNNHIKVVSLLNSKQYLEITTQQLLEFKDEELNNSCR